MNSIDVLNGIEEVAAADAAGDIEKAHGREDALLHAFVHEAARPQENPEKLGRMARLLSAHLGQPKRVRWFA